MSAILFRMPYPFQPTSRRGSVLIPLLAAVSEVAEILERHFMLRMIEHFFEAVEANIGCAVFAVLTSFVMTGCLQLMWE